MFVEVWRNLESAAEETNKDIPARTEEIWEAWREGSMVCWIFCFFFKSIWKVATMHGTHSKISVSYFKKKITYFEKLKFTIPSDILLYIWNSVNLDLWGVLNNYWIYVSCISCIVWEGWTTWKEPWRSQTDCYWRRSFVAQTEKG